MKQIEVTDVARWIQAKMQELTTTANQLDKLIDECAVASREYDKQLAFATTRLDADGKAKSLIDRLAKGECADYLYAKIIAEQSLKACYCNIDRIKAQLNACQSLNKHLDSI